MQNTALLALHRAPRHCSATLLGAAAWSSIPLALHGTPHLGTTDWREASWHCPVCHGIVMPQKFGSRGMKHSAHGTLPHIW